MRRLNAAAVAATFVSILSRFGHDARRADAGPEAARLFGTDGNRPWAPHDEMFDMVAAGMPPMQVIVAATRNGAEFLRSPTPARWKRARAPTSSCSMPTRSTTSPTRGGLPRCICAARRWIARSRFLEQRESAFGRTEGRGVVQPPPIFLFGLKRAFSLARDGSISALCNRFSNNSVRSFRAGWSTHMRQKIRQIGFAVVAALVLAYSAG